MNVIIGLLGLFVAVVAGVFLGMFIGVVVCQRKLLDCGLAITGEGVVVDDEQLLWKSVLVPMAEDSTQIQRVVIGGGNGRMRRVDLPPEVA